MSVGMLATPLTLSAAALSWILWLNFNRCSTMRIRKGDLFVLSLCGALCMHYANELSYVCFSCSLCAHRMAKLSANACIFFACVCSYLLYVYVHECYIVQYCNMCVLPHLAQGHVLSRERAETPATGVLWLICNIDFTLTFELPLIHGHSWFSSAHIHTGGFIMQTHCLKGSL